MNIVVLAGGISTEREVSLSSGSKIGQALRALGHNVFLLDSFLGVEHPNIETLFTSEIQTYQVSQIEPDLEAIRASRTGGMGSIGPNVIEICRAADLVYMGLHGEDGENGKMQAMLDLLEIPYTGSGYLGSALAMHKWLTKEILIRENIPTPKGAKLTGMDDLKRIRDFRFPCVVKPCSGGSSIGVYRCNSLEETAEAARQAFAYENEVLVEEFVTGREFSVGILGDTVLPAIEIIPRDGGFYDYAHKYQAGWTEEVCPADLTPQQAAALARYAKQVYDLLGLQIYARVDFILDATNTPYCLEANTLPGMTPTSLLPQEAAAAGISYGELCQKVVDLSLQK